MTMVGIRELKIHLSRYLRKVKKGEAVGVSEHGVQIALITPSHQATERSGLWTLVRDGKADWGGGRPKGLSPRVTVKGKPLSQSVMDDRDDRP